MYLECDTKLPGNERMAYGTEFGQPFPNFPVALNVIPNNLELVIVFLVKF